MKKITYISFYPFDKIKYDQFGIEYLKRFLNISIIDLSQAYQKERKAKENIDVFSNMIFLNDIKQIKQTLLKISPDCIVPMGPENFVNEILEVSQEFSVKSVRLFHLQTVDSSEELNLAIKIKYFLQLIFVHFDLKSFFNIFIKKIKSFIQFLIKVSLTKKKIINADIIFLAGSKSMPINVNKGVSKIVHIHSVDYQNTLDFKTQSKKNINNKEKIAIFLDQILLHHPDYKLIKNFSSPVSEKYSHELKKFFNFIKTKFNYKVIIALHPRCDDFTLSLYEKFFKLKCFRHKTMELISDSNIVISHPSTTAIAYPVIFKKPLIFITTNELEKNYYKYVTFRMTSNIIKQPFVNISNDREFEKLDKLEKLDQEGYSKYFSNYIKSNQTKEGNLWKCFLQNI